MKVSAIQTFVVEVELSGTKAAMLKAWNQFEGVESMFRVSDHRRPEYNKECALLHGIIQWDKSKKEFHDALQSQFGEEISIVTRWLRIDNQEWQSHICDA